MVRDTKDGRRVAGLSSELFKEIVSRSSQSALVVDASRPRLPILYANPAYEKVSGYGARELEGTDWLSYCAVDDDAPELVQLQKQLVCDDSAELSLAFLRKDGDIWLAQLRLIRLKASRGKRQLWLVQHPTTEGVAGETAELLKRALGQARRKLASLDRSDPATGLLSRSHFELLLRRDLAISRREKRALSLMLISLPELEIYKETFGANAADSCLRMIGAQISGTFRRASDLCARLDSTTLAVVVANQDDAKVQRLVNSVENKVRNLGLHNPRGRLSRYLVARGAFSIADPASDSIESLIGRAQEALDARTAEKLASIVS